MGIPLPALAVQQQQSPLQTEGQILGIRDLLQRQQMQQLQQQGEQQNLQSGALDLQLKQQMVKNATIAQGTLTDPNFQKDFVDWQKSKGSAQGEQAAPATQDASGAPVPLHPLAQYLMERKGLPLVGPGGALEISQSLTGNAQKMAELAKTQGEAFNQQLTAHKEQLGNFDDLVEPVLAETDLAKQQAGLARVQQELQSNPKLYPPEAVQNVGKLNSIQALQGAANTSKIRQMLVEDAEKQAQTTGAQAEAVQKTTAATPPTQQQIANANQTLTTYNAIPPNMRAGLANEIKNAPDYATLQKIQDRADQMSQSFQRSADARQQAMALKDVGIQQAVAGKITAEDEKLGATTDQTGAIRKLLDMSKGGNQEATAAAQQLFAEHIVHQGGINRFNQLEQEGLIGNMGSWGRQIGSWTDKGFKGEMPAATNSEMQTILDAEDAQATRAHDRNVGFIRNNFLNQNGGGTKKYTPPTGAPTATGPNGHKIVVDGGKWVDAQTGKPIQ